MPPARSQGLWSIRIIKEADMAKGFKLVAELRENAGKGASRRLRRAEHVPAIIYGAGDAPQKLAIEHNHLLRHMEHEAFFSSVLDVDVNGAGQQAILKDVQVHPARRVILHIDLQRIVADEEIRMTVPVHFLNEEAAIGVKLGGGTVSHMMSEVEIICLPRNLPEYLELDIGELNLDETLYLSNITVPEGVEIPELSEDGTGDRGVVSIHIIKVVEEVEETEEEGEAAEGTEEKDDEKSADEGEGENSGEK
jgi:large subunit ribosomal protein L25